MSAPILLKNSVAPPPRNRPSQIAFSAHHSTKLVRSNRFSFYRASDTLPDSAESEPMNQGGIWNSLLEALPQGTIVLSRPLKLVYWNLKARELCQALSEDQITSELPVTVSEVCHRLVRDQTITQQPLIMECQGNSGQTIRITARWFQPDALATIDPSPNSLNHRGYILLVLENCDETLREELRIEQKKYDLTDREAEVWRLLRQEYSYQEIAKMLQISLNTVKTHIKNVYAKRRSRQGQEKFWSCG